MEAKEMEKVRRRKRKRALNGSCEENTTSDKKDHDVEHKPKRIHTSSSVDVDMSEGQQERMLDTVSGHICELVTKEKKRKRDEIQDREGHDFQLKKMKTSERMKRAEKENSVKKSTKQLADDAEPSGGDGDEDGDVPSIKSNVTRESAFEYLRLWREEKEKWSFKKKTQYWLLQNMYDRTKVRKDGFKILLKYLAGLQGRQRELSLQKAKKMVDHYGEEGLSCSRRHYRRAVAIMRVLG